MGDRGPAPAVLGVLGEPVYRAVVRARNRGFDAGRRVTRLPVPVISVGNISVGGTGKTPLVMWLVELLRSEGIAAAVAMRGYKAAGGESDEAAEYRMHLGNDTPVVAQPDRVAGVRALLRERADVGCVILDDGFQHRFVARDLDIALIDATRDVFADHCLPRGWLREPVESLARADVVAITRADRVDASIVDETERRLGATTSAPIVRAAHGWSGVEIGDGQQPVTWLDARRVVCLSAIGNNEAFVSQVEAAGAEVAARITERDHHRWSARDLERVHAVVEQTHAQGVITTGKDWVKLRRLEGVRALDVPIARPRVRMDILRGEAALRKRVLTAARGVRGVGGA